MTEYIYWISLFLIFALAALLEKTIKRPALRKGLGLLLVIAGPTLLFSATSWIRDARIQSLPVIAFVTGIMLLTSQNHYRRTRTTHPLLIAPTLNLAPNFPDDPLMLHLLQLLHEGIGLPKYQPIYLHTSINHDLSGTLVEAKHLIAALTQDFDIKMGDYKHSRYFKGRRLNAHLKYVEKGNAGKVPLTINMLYQAIKAKHWDSQALEAFGYQVS